MLISLFSRFSGFPPHDATAGGVPPPDGGMGVPPPIGPKRGFSMGSAEDRAGKESKDKPEI